MTPQTTADYQILIVGSGISGLHCALRLSEAFPKFKIAVAESYKTTGGRIATYSERGLQWEEGAGRIANSHTMVKKYVNHYGLTQYPLQSHNDWRSINPPSEGKDTWQSFTEIVVKSLSGLSQRTLATHTIQELLRKFYGNDAEVLMKFFPYVAEVSTLRADLALAAFKHEMKSPEGFFVVGEGFAAITDCMKKELEGRGVDFLVNHRLSAVEPNTSPIVCKFAGAGSGTGPGTGPGPHPRITADKVILAIPSKALQKINPFQNLPVLKNIAMCSLLRTYGVFPTKKDAWFKGMLSTVTDSPLRYVIPVNAEKGIIMTSYTDSTDTIHWTKLLKKGETCLKDAIMEELRRTFPEKNIPDPTLFKAHSWELGCSYWLPGLYDPEVASERIMCPLPGTWRRLYVCGESYSMRQAWVEGALEHSEKMLKKYFL